MNIAIVGLGIMGGSYAKAISEYTDNNVFAISHNEKSISKAIEDGAIIRSIHGDELKNMDMTIVCLPPEETLAFLQDNAKNMKEGSIVSDICGVKSTIANKVQDIYTKYRVNYISIHPMAGRECSGYDSAIADLFLGRSLVIIDNDNVKRNEIEKVEALHRLIGFTKIVHTTATNHDRIIAYTSQMCHITSNAFVKSPTSREHYGFSGGSFEDLTRVAYLDPKIWITLFRMNHDALLDELNIYIDELKKYQQALANKDYDMLYDLLLEGRTIKSYISNKE